MKFRPTLSHVVTAIMVVTLCCAIWKLFSNYNNTSTLLFYKNGDHIPSAIWRTVPDPKRTVLLVNRSGCEFCTASMKFYVQMVTAASAAGVEVVSVTPEDSDTNHKYLDSHDVHVTRIVQLKDTPLKVAATPTLIIMDQSKMVLGAWVGQLDKDGEQNVLHVVNSGVRQ